MADTTASATPKIDLDPAKLLLLGGTSGFASSNTRMIGAKWSVKSDERPKQ